MPVYFIGEDENGCSPIKVGVAKDIGRRKSDLQTGNPLELKLLGWITSADDFETERDLHRRLASRRGRGEWFYIEPADVLPFLMEVGQRGFVAKNAGAFEITGYDRDAVPEYLGVWEWVDLEIDECCPFCGCLCGVHFQEASQMYYCIQCDTLTDFSELSPDERDGPEDFRPQDQQRMGHNMSMQWLLARAPGFQALPEEDRAAIFNFTFLWSLFEAQVMGNFARADLICAKADEWRDAGTLNADQYDGELAYLRQRYFANGHFTRHFAHLHLRPADQPNLVRSVLDGSNNDARDRMVTVMMIVWRFRNNLFHGEKWAYQLQGQLSNFAHANAVLIRLLEQHGQLAA